MFEGGEGATCVVQMAEINLAHGETVTAFELIEDGAPWVHDHAMAIGLTTAYMVATLGRSDHVTQVLNSPGLDQRVPVGFTGLGGEGCRKNCYLHALVYQIAELLREAQVVAYGKADASEWRVNHYGIGTGFYSV